MTASDRYIAFLIKAWLKVEALAVTKSWCLMYLDITEDTPKIYGSYVQQHFLKYNQETDIRTLRYKLDEPGLLSALTALGFTLFTLLETVDVNSYLVEYQHCYVGRIYVKEIYRA